MNGESISARSAVTACGLFGIRENSVRVALVRLVANGLVEVVGRGAYRLGPEAMGLAADVAGWREIEQRGRPWGGGWIAVHAGGLGRSDRAVVQRRERALAMLGLRELERGLYLRPDNLEGGVSGVRERLLVLGMEADAAVFAVQELDLAREKRARTLWDSEDLTRSYRNSRGRLESWLARRGKLDQDTIVRESYLLGNDAIRQIIFDPLLPEPLIDIHERRAFVDAVKYFDREGRVIWRKQLSLPERSAVRLSQ